MNAETLEKAKSLQRQISDYETDLKELENGCGIFVDKQGKVYIKTEREWSSKTANRSLPHFGAIFLFIRLNIGQQ